MKPAFAKQATPSPTLALPGQRFVARQPIFDRARNVFGYELLFRNGIENYFNADPETAARSTLDSSLLFGMNTLCDNRRAFVNCTREVLFKDRITLLPPGQVAFGYMIALDDFAPNDPRIPLVEYDDIIKVDLLATRPEERASMVRRFGSAKCKMLAEKLATPHEFYQAREMGFAYFQG